LLALKFSKALSEIHNIEPAEIVWNSYCCWSGKSSHLFQPLMVCHSKWENSSHLFQPLVVCYSKWKIITSISATHGMLFQVKNHTIYFSHSWYVIPPHQIDIKSKNILHTKFIP